MCHQQNEQIVTRVFDQVFYTPTDKIKVLFSDILKKLWVSFIKGINRYFSLILEINFLKELVI